MTDSLVETGPYLDPAHPPPDVFGRNDEQEVIRQVLPSETGGGKQNLHLSGPHGAGNSLLVNQALDELDERIATCSVSCTEKDTQYKVLRAITETVTGEDIGPGYHSSDLKRTIEDRTGVVPLVVVLDDVDFLLCNDGDSLLYFLSRLTDSEDVTILTISSHKTDLRDAVEQRTYSSLYPQTVELDRYGAEAVYRILSGRVERALRPRSIHRGALTYVASSISDIRFGLHWIREAVNRADNVVSEETVKESYADTCASYSSALLDDFTDHHRLLYDVIETEIDERTSGAINTGVVYERYQSRCKAKSLERLSNRRISDFLTDLELLDLVRVNYHYGGSEGKTRKIRINHPV